MGIPTLVTMVDLRQTSHERRLRDTGKEINLLPVVGTETPLRKWDRLQSERQCNVADFKDPKRSSLTPLPFAGLNLWIMLAQNFSFCKLFQNPVQLLYN